MKKNVAAHCPYCGNMINYFYLYDAKRSDFGYCSHCGGMYAVKYSPLAYLLVIGALGALIGGFAFWYLANKTLPGADYLTTCTVVITVLYFLMPLLITPRRVIVRGRLGGFPSPEYIPVHRRDRKHVTRKLVVKHRTEVLHPQEDNTDGIKDRYYTENNQRKPGGRFQRQQEEQRLRKQTAQNSRQTNASRFEKNTESKQNANNTNGIIQKLVQQLGVWGSGLKTTASSVGTKFDAWWKRCFRKRETPGKGK